MDSSGSSGRPEGDSRSGRRQDRFDEDVERELGIIQVSLAKLVGISFAIFCCLILMEVHKAFSFDLSLIFIALIVIEGGLGFFQVLHLKFYGFDKIRVLLIIGGLVDMVFCVVLIIIVKVKHFPMCFLSALLCFNIFIIHTCRKASRSKPLKLMLLFEMFIRTCCAIGIVFINLKVSAVLNWSWLGIFWPFWLLMAFYLITSAFSIGKLITSATRYTYVDVPAQDLIISIWYFYVTTGGCLSGTVFLVRFIPNLDQICLIPLLIYFFPLSISTLLLCKQLASFFLSNENSQSIDSNHRFNYQPGQFRQSSETKSFIQYFPPIELERLTSTYFKPKNIRKSVRTMSEANVSVDPGTHFRNLTSPNISKVSQVDEVEEEANSSFMDKKCSICCELDCDAVIQPCGHGGICMKCSVKMVRMKKRCMICRTQICKVLKIEVGKGKMVRVVGFK